LDFAVSADRAVAKNIRQPSVQVLVSMESRRILCCTVWGACLGLSFVSLAVIGLIEKRRFEPFYQDVECPESKMALKMSDFSLPPSMTPPGLPPSTPPFGLFGNFQNLTSICRNPNQVELTTKKKDFQSTFYMPDLSNWTWGISEKDRSSGKINGSYLSVASITLLDDYVLPSDDVGVSHTKVVADAPMSRFAGFMQSALLTGYAPFYLKTVATSQSCVRILGMDFCGMKETTIWCGNLGGNCLAPAGLPGIDLWVPALCSFTKTVCKMGGDEAEAEMKALVTAENLGVKTLAVPCKPQTGLPPTMNCPIPLAAGINATLHQVQVPGFVDGPRPKDSDLESGEDAIRFVTALSIIIGVIGAVLSFCLTFCLACRLKRRDVAATKSATALPTIITPRGAVSDKEASV